MGPAIFAVIALAYFYFASRERINAVVGAAALLPYHQYLPSSGVPLLNVQTVIVVGVLSALARPSQTAGRTPRASVPAALKALAILIAAQYLHSFFVELPPEYRALFDPWKNFLNFKEAMTVFLMFAASFILADTNREIVRVMWGAALGFGFETVFCCLEFFLRATKVTGHLEVRNATGAFLATYAVASLGFYVGAKSAPRRWMFLALHVAGVLGALGTRSRGAVLALGAAAAFIALMRSRILFLILMVAAFNYQLWMPQPLLDRFGTAVVVNDEGKLEAADTAAQREEIWKAGFRTIPDYPFGLGYGTYAFIVPKYGLEEILVRPVKNAHNDVVLVTVEFGVLGLLLYVWLLATVSWRAWTVARKDDDPMLRGLGMGAFAGLMGVSAAGIAGNFILRLDIAGILWILLGLAARRSTVLRSLRQKSPNAGHSVVGVTSS